MPIGFDRINGYLADGIEAWESAGLPVEATGRLDLERLKVVQDLPAAPMIIDVRQRSEFHSAISRARLTSNLRISKTTWRGCRGNCLW